MYKVLGYQIIEGNSKKTGKPISAVVLYLSGQGGPRVIGDIVFEQFVSRDILPKLPEIGDVIQIQYNRNGYVEAVEI